MFFKKFKRSLFATTWLTALIFSLPLEAGQESIKDRSQFNSFALRILDQTHFFEAYPNFVEQSEEALRFRDWLNAYRAEEIKAQSKSKQSPRLTRGLASDQESSGAEQPSRYGGSFYEQRRAWQLDNMHPTDPAEALCRAGTNCTTEEQFQRERPAVAGAGLGLAAPASGFSDATPAATARGISAPASDFSEKYDLNLSERDYQVRGNMVVDCTERGTQCIEVGPVDRYRFVRSQPESGGQDLKQFERNQFDDYFPEDEYAAPNGGSTSPSEPGSGGPGYASSPGRDTGTTSQPSSQVAESFRRCESAYQRAIRLCGTSSQAPDSNFVKNELNLRSGMQLASYLSSARLASQQQGRSMYEICDATERMAKSMTALNASYTAICFSAQQSCSSSCSRANSYQERTDISDEEFVAAANSQSSGFNPQRYFNTCQNDMNSQTAQGLFQTAQTVQMMNQASSCKEQIAAGGPCATPDMWDSQACQNHCQNPENSYQPACARFSAMNANCSNPQFASQNPMCLCVNHPNDPSCRGGTSGPTSGLPESDGGGYLPGGSSEFASRPTGGSFGSGANPQRFQGGQASQSSSGQSQGSFPGGGGGGPRGGGGSGGGGAPGNAAGGVYGSAFNPNIMDGVQSFGGARRGQQPQKRYIAQGDMNSDNPYRRISVETDDPNFNLKDYLPPEDYQFGKGRKFYYGKDEIGGPHGPSIFEMVSRRYRALAPEMMK